MDHDAHEAGMRMELLPPEPPRKQKFPMSTPEFFAAHFLTRIETDMTDIDLPDEYRDDPRTQLIGHAMRSVGVSRVRIVGGGSFGLAAATPGRIAKLTSDETETVAASVLRGKRLPHVAHVYGSWNVAGAEVEHWYSGLAKTGLILQEKVEPIDTNEDPGEMLTDVWNRVRTKHDAFAWVLASMPRTEARKRLYEASMAMEEQLLKEHKITGIRLFRDVADALAELQSHGIYAIDVHAGNVGYSEQDGVYKLFDVGSSSSPEGAEVPEASEGGRRRGRGVMQTPAMVNENVVVEEIGAAEPGRMPRMIDDAAECRLERSYESGGCTHHQVSTMVEDQRFVVVVVEREGQIEHTQAYVGLLRQPAEDCDATRRAEMRARRVVRESVGGARATVAEEAPAGLVVRNEVFDSHRGETFGAVSAWLDGHRVGNMPWSEYNGETAIKMINVAPGHRRQGVASAMYAKLREESEGEIDWGGMTPEGKALHRNLKQRRALEAREAPRSVADAPSLPYALVRVGDDVLPLLLGDDGDDDGLLTGINIVDGTVLRFGAEDIVGAVNTEPAAVFYGVEAEMAGAEMQMAAERRLPAGSMREVDARTAAVMQETAWVYHATTESALKRIRKDGLTPHRQPRKHRDEQRGTKDAVTFFGVTPEAARAWGSLILRFPWPEESEEDPYGDTIQTEDYGVIASNWYTTEWIAPETIEIQTSSGWEPLVARGAAEDGPGKGVKKGDVIIEYPGFRAYKGKPFKVRPRGQRFQWTPEKPQGLSAFPEVEPVLLKQRATVPSLESIQMAAMFAGLTVHAGTEEAEETFGMLLSRYHAMHGSWPPLEQVMDIMRRHQPTLRSQLYETVPAWSQIVQDALKRGLKDRELRQHIWVDLNGEDQVASLGLAKMSLAFMLLGQNVMCADSWILGYAFAPQPEDAESRRPTADRISSQWKWHASPKTRALALRRYEQVEDAVLKNNPWCKPGPIWRARCQWVSWEWALNTQAAHRVWLEVTKKIHAQAEFPRPEAPF